MALARRAALLLALCIVCGALGSHAAETVLPTETCRGYFLTELAVGGDASRTLHMLIDTGASRTIVDPDALERVSGRRLASGKSVRFAEASAGDVRFSRLRARTGELDHLERALGRPLDGILGFPAFADVLLVFDYPAEQVRVAQGRLPGADGGKLLRMVGEKRRPFVEIDFGGHPRPVLIDTGSGAGFALNGSERLEWEHPPRPYRGSVRFTRIETVEAGRLANDVTLGTLVLRKPTAERTEATELVGGGVLKHFVLTFDQRRRVVRLQTSRDDPVEFEPLRGTGMVLNPAPEGHEVLRVFDATPAAGAGIRPGDLIVAVDGVPVYERDLCDPAIREVERPVFTVERKGERRDIAVELEVLVP